MGLLVHLDFLVLLDRKGPRAQRESVVILAIQATVAPQAQQEIEGLLVSLGLLDFLVSLGLVDHLGLVEILDPLDQEENQEPQVNDFA